MVQLSKSYQYIARSSAMSAPNGANYYVIMQAQRMSYQSADYQRVFVKFMLACTESSSFYDHKTQYSISIDGVSSGNKTNKPDKAWSTSPVTINGVAYKKWIEVDTFYRDIDGLEYREIPLSISFTFTDTATESYTPATGTRRTVSATVKVPALETAASFTSISAATKYLDSTITCNYALDYVAHYIRRDVYINNEGTLTTIRGATLLGKKSAGTQTSAINLSDEELSAIYAKLKTTTKATLRVKFTTYKDSDYTEKVGSDYGEITLTIPESVKPSLILTAEPLTGIKWILSKGLYVTGSVSNARVIAKGEAGEGADLVSTSIIDLNGVDYKTAIATIFFKDAGEYTFTAKVVDSRGRYATDTITLDVLPYDSPSVTKMQAERGTYSSKWTANDNGPDVRVKFKTTLSLSNNGNTYEAWFKLDDKTVTPASGSTYDLNSGEEYSVYFKNIDGEQSHRLAMSVYDLVGLGMTTTITIPTLNVTLEYNASGKGIAFGKPSEKDALECAWPMYLSDDLFLATKITCNNPFSLRNFNISSYWADNAIHDMLVRINDGLTLGLGWSGSADDGTSYDTVLDVRPKLASFRGTVTAPRGRFTATNDASGTEQKDVPLRVGDAEGSHIDFDTNEIQVKEGPTTPGPLYLNLDGGAVYAGDFKIPEIQRGSVTIKPTAANTPTSADVTFAKAFSGTPTVIVTPATSVPGTTVLGAGVNSVSATGCKIWTTRTNTTDTIINWIAVY